MEPMLVLESERVPRSVRRKEVFGMDEAANQAQLARLTSDVQHVQKDVTDIKVDLRRVDDRLVAINERIDSMKERFDGKLDGLRAEIYSMKIWAMGMYFALAGSLLFVMAKGFKWL
jgi:peptidoglycan hydrolase CwlO-like protein